MDESKRRGQEADGIADCFAFVAAIGGFLLWIIGGLFHSPNWLVILLVFVSAVFIIGGGGILFAIFLGSRKLRSRGEKNSVLLEVNIVTAKRFPMGHHAFGSEHVHRDMRDYKKCMVSNWFRRIFFGAMCAMPIYLFIVNAIPAFLCK